MNNAITLSVSLFALLSISNSFANETIIPKYSGSTSMISFSLPGQPGTDEMLSHLDRFDPKYTFSEKQRLEQTYAFDLVRADCGLSTNQYRDQIIKIRMFSTVNWKSTLLFAGNGIFPQEPFLDAKTSKVQNNWGTNIKSSSPFTNDSGDGYLVPAKCTSKTPTVQIVNGKFGLSTPADPALFTIGSDSITGPCPSGQSGTMTVYRQFFKWVNKEIPSSNFIPTKYVNTCEALSSTVETQNAVDTCPEGQIGTIEKSRTYLAYSDGTSDNFSDWTISANSCVDVPKETVTPYHFEETCDSYYGVAKGSYVGMVMKSGNNVTNSSGETTFNLVSTDTSSCVKQFSDVKETISETACPDGQSGTIISAVYTAESGTGTIYPYGQAPVVKSNTCVTPLDSGSTANPEAATGTAPKSGVLSNMSFTVSQLSADGEALAAEISQFDSTKSEGTHTFNIVANSLNAKTLNASNVTKVIKAYKKASGDSNTFVKVGGLSQSIYDYIGQAGLTAQRISSEKLVLLSSKEESGLVTVKYASYLNPLKAGDVQSFTVKIYNP